MLTSRLSASSELLFIKLENPEFGFQAILKYKVLAQNPKFALSHQENFTYSKLGGSISIYETFHCKKFESQ